MEKITKETVRGFYPEATSIKIGDISEVTIPWMKEQGITHKVEVLMTIPIPFFNKKTKSTSVFIFQNNKWNYYSQK